MKYSFSALQQNIFNRKFGGTTVGIADPMVTGYGFSFFDRLPPRLHEYTNQGNSTISSVNEIQNILAASCLGVTPPGGTINKIEFQGLGGIKWAVPGGVDYGNSVSVKFLEFSKSPILDIMHGWCKLMRDYRTGVSKTLISGPSGAGYTKAQYAGVLYYWTTAPDGVSVEYYACYDGVFPTKDPQDLYSFDIENIGKLEVEIEFNVDYIWHEPWVLSKCQSFANTFSSVQSTIANYGQNYA